MKKLLVLLSIVGALVLLGTSLPAAAATPAPPRLWQAHPPIHAKPFASTSPSGYSPTQIRQAYGFSGLSGDGSGETIAIIDAYDDPTIQSDLQTFISTFGLAPMIINGNGSGPWFKQVYAQGSQPRKNAGWALEISLDVEWAHAIAPGANILLVEAADSSFSNLLGGVDLAVSSGANVVSMSWGGSEFSGETAYDSHFQHPGIVFTASSGDSGAGVEWPAASPYVLGVGGTTLPLDGNGNLTGAETAWSGSGGGVSSYETEPGYQANVFTNANRGIPDVSYDADPNTGFSVYDSTRDQGQSGWWEVGGTSAGAPQWAALVAVADQTGGISLSTDNLNSSAFYTADTVSGNYRDITQGSNGYAAGTGYDLVTGVGSPLAASLVPYLAGTPVSTSPDFSLSMSPASQSVLQGSGASYTVNIGALDGFSGTVDLAAGSLPSGATATFSPTAATSSSVLTVTTSSATPAGSYTITVTGTSGSLSHVVTAALTVTSQSTATSVSVTGITYSTSGGKNHDNNVAISVSLTDNLGNPVTNASVSITVDLDGAAYASGTGTTGSAGTASFNMNHAPSGTYTTTVTAVSASGLTWDGTTPSNSFTK